MKNNVLKFILILSLLLNASMLVSATYTHYNQSRQKPVLSSVACRNPVIKFVTASLSSFP